MKKIFTLVWIVNCAIYSHSQETLMLIEDVNKAIDQTEHYHIKTKYVRKYYTSSDTTTTLCESWIYETSKDTVLGMYIKTKSTDGEYFYEWLHKDTLSWMVNGRTDTITRYNQNNGEWDGFNGNIKSSYTIHTPLSVGIQFGEEDSVSSVKLENGDWLIERFSDDLPEYGMTDLYRKWWVDEKTLLPYRTANGWKDGERETYNALNIELISTDKEDVLSEIDKPLPNYPVISPVKFDPEKFKPHVIGTDAPEMKGIFLKDSSEFDLANFLDAPLILIDFWYQACGPCIRAVPYLDSLENEFADRGFKLFEMNSRDHKTSPEVLMKVIDSRGGNSDNIVMIDYETESQLWKSWANPTFYLVKNGQIVWVQQGFSPELMEEFRKAISEFIE